MTDVTFDNLNAVLDDIAQTRKSYEDKIKAVAKPIFKQVQEALKEYPNLGISWTQYTPYFNDGEECVFSVGDIWIVPADFEGGYAEDESFYLDNIDAAIAYKKDGTLELDTWYVSNKGEDYARARALDHIERYLDEETYPDLEALKMSVAAVEKITEKLAKLPDDLFRDAFGDHVSVVITANKCEEEEYSHD